jgi:lipoprotein-anchoring transpeptidase ErfK/SrfK
VLRRAVILAIISCCVLAAGCVGVVVAAVASMTGSQTAPSVPILPSTAGISKPPRSGLSIPGPKRLDSSEITARWASLTRTTPIYRAPSPDARLLGRVGGHTPEGTVNVVLIKGYAQDPAGGMWVRVQIPGKGSAPTGWLPGDVLNPGGVSRAKVLVDREHLTLTYIRAGKVLLTAPIGIGRADSPTPAGTFYIRNKLTRYASAWYGPLAFGTSAQSDLSDWPAGGFIGIHGTNRPELLPGAVSHGCIRMTNQDILRLGRMLRVGTPVVIV